ncbi:MAG: hypothetical protein ACREO1_03730 [Arenimonas sp.]
MSNKTLQLTASMLLFGCLYVSPVNAVDDDSVKKRLDERSISFDVDKDGDYKIVYSFEKEKRSQLVFISGSTETIQSMKIREIFAPAANMKSAGIDDKKALELLTNSRKNKLGSWEVSNDMLFLVVKIPDSVNAVELEIMLDAAAGIADEMELKLTGKDEL